jgi:hypothetical protein
MYKADCLWIALYRSKLVEQLNEEAPCDTITLASYLKSITSSSESLKVGFTPSSCLALTASAM